MNITQFKDLVLSFGADPARWPLDRRVAALAFLDENDDARQLLAFERHIDVALDQYDPAVDLPGLEARILNRVNQRTGWVDRLAGWLMPDFHSPSSLWRPVFAASLPLVLGVVLGSNLSIETESYTVDEEIYLMGLSADGAELDAEFYSMPQSDRTSP